MEGAREEGGREGVREDGGRRRLAVHYDAFSGYGGD